MIGDLIFWTIAGPLLIYVSAYLLLTFVQWFRAEMRRGVDALDPLSDDPDWNLRR